MKQVTITTDGGCHPNPGDGGWAAVLRFGETVREIWGNCRNTTNNQMEMRAVLEAIRALKEPCCVTIRTDSKNAIAWCRQGYFSKVSKRIKFPESYAMSLEFDRLRPMHEISFEWVRGHSGDPDNERCDVLAAEARRQLTAHLRSPTLFAPAP